MRKSLSDKAFDTVIYTVLVILCLITLYPFVYTFILSFLPIGITGLDAKSIISNLNTATWQLILNSSYMWVGFKNSVFRTIAATAISIIITITMAYPLSKKDMIFGKFINSLLALTMVLGAGIIPTYLLMKYLHILDTFWVLVIPGAVNVFNIMVMRNYFSSIPDAIEESAKIDGANDILILFRIIVPLSMPTIATILLWLLVENWNSWFDVVMYINSRNKYLLPAILQEMLSNQEVESSFKQTNGLVQPVGDSLKAATTIFTMIPILLVYPFLQKYFAAGVMIGAVKG